MLASACDLANRIDSARFQTGVTYVQPFGLSISNSWGLAAHLLARGMDWKFFPQNEAGPRRRRPSRVLVRPWRYADASGSDHRLHVFDGGQSLRLAQELRRAG